MMFSYVLDRKQAFLDYQNIDFTLVTELQYNTIIFINSPKGLFWS